MRLFVAVDLDERARLAIAEEQKRLRAAVEGVSALRWIRPEHMHLTLVFLGEVAPPVSTAVVEAIATPVAQQPFEIVFKGVGAFPPHGAPRALWIGVESGASELSRLQAELARRVAAVGIPLDSRPFSAHLTLGRWKTSRPSDRRRALAQTTNSTVARVLTDHATLYESRLLSTGPTYIELARANLVPRP